MSGFFLAEFNEEMKVNEGGGLDEEQEDIQVLKIDFDQAWNMMKTGEIRDAKTVILLQHLKLEGLME